MRHLDVRLSTSATPKTDQTIRACILESIMRNNNYLINQLKITSMEEREECRTKAEMENEIESLKIQLESTKNEREEFRKAMSYWADIADVERNKTSVYEKRLKAMQYTITILAGMIGEVDVTALTKEEQA